MRGRCGNTEKYNVHCYIDNANCIMTRGGFTDVKSHYDEDM